MDEESKNIFLQNLDEYVLDEEKIVTVRWLSKTLNIKHNDATNILDTWIKNKRSKSDVELLVTYVITGNKKDGMLIVTVLRENALENAIQDLTNVSKSVYSVQKGCILKDIQLLAAVDPTFTPCLGAIKCPITTRRVTAIVKQAATVSETFEQTKTDKVVKSSFNDVSKPKVPEKLLATQQSKVKEVKGGISTFFNKANSKAPSNASKNEVSAKPNAPKKVQDFFKKVTPPKSSTAEATKIEIPAPEVENIKPEISSPVKEEEPMSEDEIIECTPDVKKTYVKKRGAKKNALSKKTKRTKENSDEDSKAKRRKRIVAQSDSSDDDIFGKESDADEKEDAPDIKPITNVNPESPVAKALKQNSLNNKRKRYVNKTYTDEDGFIITCREVEEYSGSEEEEEEKVPPKTQPKQSPVKSVAKKPAANTNTKQSNLMSFFKKK